VSAPIDQETIDQELIALRERVKALQPLAEEFRLIIENITDYGLVRFDTEGRIAGWSKSAERIVGYTEEEAIGQYSSLMFTPEDIAAGEPEKELAKATRDGRAEDERWQVRKDGSRFWGSGVMNSMRNADGQLFGYYKVIRDLTARKQAEEAVRRSEDQLRRFVDNVKDYALVQVDRESNITSWNIGAQRMFGYQEHEILLRPISILLTADDRAANLALQDLELAASEGRFEAERWMVRKDQTLFISRWVTTPIRDDSGQLLGFAKVLRDETERRASEARLRASLLERETLIKEIHHRVKNNLQVIVSLLSLQSNQIADLTVRSMFQDTQNRVQAIASIHENLYSSADLANIEFGEYTRRLVEDLYAFFGGSPDRIRLEIDTADLVLDITQAIPLGLILNEVVVNCLKHAFPEGRKGRIKIKLGYVDKRSSPEQTLDEGMGQLSIEDDGIGMPKDFSFERADSMGMYLVRVLGRQLRAVISLEQQIGTRFVLTFPLTVEGAGAADDGS
jgi:PAS domain S-box-containing protein